MGNVTVEYHKLLEKILKQGKDKEDRTGTGTRSIFHHTLEMDMSDGFPLITTKKIHTRSVIHELLWFLKGDTNIKYLNDNGVTIWDEWADKNGNLGPVYGHQWINWENETYNGVATTNEPINQIQNAIDTLKNNPDSRRILVSAWNVGDLDKMALMPCHWSFELYTEELTSKEMCEYVGVDYNEDVEKEWAKQNRYDTDAELKTILVDIYNAPKRRLHLKFHMRSVDTFLGLPFNITSYALLLHMFAQQTNMVPGTLVGDLTNVHIYDNHITYVEEQLGRVPNRYKSPTLKLNNSYVIDAGDNGQRFYKDIFNYKFEDFVIEDYKSYTNWRNVPIAV